MKTALVALSLLVAASALTTVKASTAQAAQAQVLLDCNLSFGPDQAVRVLKTESGLVLEELTNKGSFVRRALSTEEFASNELRLRIESPFDQGTLTLEEDGNWFYDIGGAKGYADCR